MLLYMKFAGIHHKLHKQDLFNVNVNWPHSLKTDRQWNVNKKTTIFQKLSGQNSGVSSELPGGDSPRLHTWIKPWSTSLGRTAHREHRDGYNCFRLWRSAAVVKPIFMMSMVKPHHADDA